MRITRILRKESKKPCDSIRVARKCNDDDGYSKGKLSIEAEKILLERVGKPKEF